MAKCATCGKTADEGYVVCGLCNATLHKDCVDAHVATIHPGASVCIECGTPTEWTCSSCHQPLCHTGNCSTRHKCGPQLDNYDHVADYGVT